MILTSYLFLFFFPEGFVLLWMRNAAIIAVGEQIIEKDPRYKLEKSTNGNTLTIALAEEADAGNYTCQISTFKPSNLYHSIKIRGKTKTERKKFLLHIWGWQSWHLNGFYAMLLIKR